MYQQQQMAPVRRERRPVPGAASFDQTNPIIYLGTVAGIAKARARAGSLVAPLDADPELFSWPVLQASVLLVSEPDYAQQAARLAGVLIRNGAQLVVIVDGTRSSPRIHRGLGHPHSDTMQRKRATLDVDVPNFD